MNSLPQFFLSRDLMRATGISHRKLQWWDEHGALSPSRIRAAGGQGIIRTYRFEEVVIAALANELLRRRVITSDRKTGQSTIRKVFVVARRLQKESPEFVLITSNLKQRPLDRMHSFDDMGRLIRWAERYRGGFWVLAVGEIVQRISERLQGSSKVMKASA